MVRGFDIEYSFNLQQVIFDVYQYYREEEIDKIEVGDSCVIIAKIKLKFFLIYINQKKKTLIFQYML